MAKLLGWDQDVTTVYARFTVPKGTRASQVRVDAAVNSLLVFVLPADSTLSYVYEGQKEGGELRKSIGALHTDMARLNELIGVNQKSVAVLEGDNFTLETDMANTLKDLEEEAVRLENQVPCVV